MKRLFFSLSLLNTALLFAGAGSSEGSAQLTLPKIRIGTASTKGTVEFPYCVSFNEELKVFGHQPSHLVGSFYTNSKLAAIFLQRDFLNILRAFQKETDISNFSKTLETQFNRELTVARKSTEEHADIINSARVTFSFLHLLTTGYCNITGTTPSSQSVFATNWFNGTSGGGPLSPYYGYDNLLTSLFIMHLNAAPREQYAIAGALQAGSDTDAAAKLALTSITDKRKQSDNEGNSNVLTFVQLCLDQQDSGE